VPEEDGNGNETGRMIQIDRTTGKASVVGDSAPVEPVAAPVAPVAPVEQAAPVAPAPTPAVEQQDDEAKAFWEKDAADRIAAEEQNAPAPDVAPTKAAVSQGLTAPQVEVAQDQADGIEITKLTSEQVGQIETDAKVFQYKDDGDQNGVTTVLQGTKGWDQRSAAGAIIYEYANGRRVVADGHQRLGLAKRLQAEGQKTPWNVEIIREVDGYTPADVRTLAALKNIRQGSGTPIDAAKVLRETPTEIEALNLPPTSALVRNAKGLAKLSDDAFGMTVNKVVKYEWAAVVGSMVADTTAHSPIMGLLKKLEPGIKNLGQVESIVAQAMQTTATETQTDMFGDTEVTANRYLERAKIIDSTMSSLKLKGKVFKALLDKSDLIQNAGNQLNQSGNATIVDDVTRVTNYIRSQANMKGPVSDALTAAANQLAAKPKAIGEAVKFFLDAINGPEVQNANGTEYVSGGAGNQGSQLQGPIPNQEITPAAAPAAPTIDGLEVAPDPRDHRGLNYTETGGAFGRKRTYPGFVIVDNGNGRASIYRENEKAPIGGTSIDGIAKAMSQYSNPFTNERFPVPAAPAAPKNFIDELPEAFIDGPEVDMFGEPIKTAAPKPETEGDNADGGMFGDLPTDDGGKGARDRDEIAVRANQSKSGTLNGNSADAGALFEQGAQPDIGIDAAPTQADAPKAKTDDVIGKTWKTPRGTKVVTGIDDKGRYLVRENDERSADLLTEKEVFETETLDTRNLESKNKNDAALAEREAKEAAVDAELRDLDGFTDGMTPMAAGNAVKVLSVKMRWGWLDGATLSRRDAIRRMVSEGWTLNQMGNEGLALVRPSDEAYYAQPDITKAGLDYAKHLIEEKPATTTAKNPESGSQGTGDMDDKARAAMPKGYTFVRTEVDAARDGQVTVFFTDGLDEFPAYGSTLEKALAEVENLAATFAQINDSVNADKAPAAKPAKAGVKFSGKRADDTASMLTLAEQDELARLRAEMRDMFKNQLNSGIDPNIAIVAGKMAAIYIKAGARKFRDLIRAMMEDMELPFKVARPYAQKAYNEARDEMDISGDDISGMDTSADVMAQVKEMISEDSANVSSTSSNVEPDRGGANAANPVGAGNVPPASGRPSNGAADGGKATDSAGGVGNGGGDVSQGNAASVGGRGNSGGSGSTRPVAGNADNQDGAGGGNNSQQRLQLDEGTTKDTEQYASDNADITDRAAAQAAADKLPVIPGDEQSIRNSLPLLLPEQQDDVLKIETRYAKPDGHGMMLTNGTGTGKTYSGLGIVKRFLLQGKTNIMIVAPSQGILDGWIKMGLDVGVPITKLEDSKSAGTGIVATSYANLGDNPELAKREWDLIVTDESDNLMSSASGKVTKALKNMRGITNRPADLYHKVMMLHAEEWDALHPKVRKGARIQRPSDAVAQAQRDLSNKIRIETNALVRSQPPRSKVLFLSATPWAYDRNTDYAEGYLFDYPADGTTDSGSNQSGQNFFMVQNFGYRIRYHKLTKPEAAVDSGVFEREMHEKLKREGVLSGRALQIEADYDRKFVRVQDAQGEQIDEALDYIRDNVDRQTDEGQDWAELQDHVAKNFNYLRRMQLLEAIKAKAAIPDIKAHLKMGRKVVVFHDYNVGGGFNPFTSEDTVIPTDGALRAYDLLLAALPFVKKLDFEGYGAPIDSLTAEFGDRAVLYDGTITNKKRSKNKDDFNRDGSGVDIIIVQSDAGKSGLSLHDVTNKHQRILINLGMPTKPTVTLQEEGRIRRVGSMSDAAFRYYTIGTNWERTAFANRIAGQSGTVENLAMGNEARTIRDSFINAYMDADFYDPSPDDGKGGKEADRSVATTSPYDVAKTHYYGRMRNTRNRNQRQGFDFYATPEPVGMKMAQWIMAREYDRVLEPSSGDGAIARYLPADTDRTLIDPSSELLSTAQLRAPGARALNEKFEDHHIINKYDAIAMNPPFGSGGKVAMEHFEKAMRHVKPGGRIVALIPRGGAADKRFIEMYESEAAKGFYLVGEILMPSVTFEKAGTAVMTRIVVMDRLTDAESRGAAMVLHDLTNTQTIAELFDRIQDVDMPPRAIPAIEDVADVAITESLISGPTADVDASVFDVFEFFHSKTGKNKFAVNLVDRVDPDRFKEVTSVARKNGGYWSPYVNKADGVRAGFLFKNNASRAQFMADLQTPISSMDQANPQTRGDRPDNAGAKTVAEKPYAIWGKREGKVVAYAATKQGGRNSVDRRDNQYGGYNHRLIDNPSYTGPETSRDQAAYHGTPHDFDKFSLDAMGSGEGAQAYGWGMYFAGRKEVAEGYKASLKRNVEQLEVIAKQYGLTGDGASMLAYQFGQDFQGQTFDVWLDGLKKYLDESDPLAPTRSMKAIAQVVEMEVEASDAVRKMKGAGKLFTVEVPEDSDMLNWSKPLKDQSEKVKAAIKPLVDRLSGSRMNDYDKKDIVSGKATGEIFYRALAAEMAQGQARVFDDQAASEAMREVGIPGHRFLDGGSRQSGEGSYNYVVYDESAVSVTNKEQAAYHGTPHDFDNFSLGAMGTGEGAQAFGWGMYFAGRRGVAEHYRDVLSADNFTDKYGNTAKDYDRETLVSSIFEAIESQETELTDRAGSFNALEDLVLEMADAMRDGDNAALSSAKTGAYRDVYGSIVVAMNNDGWKVTEGKGTGKLFTVDVPEDSDLIDYDKLMKDQPPKVRAILKDAGLLKEHRENMSDFASPQDSRGKGRGYNFYKYLSFKMGGDKAASEYLRSIGIPGHRFLDGGSRGNGKGSHNYVIYDETAVQVTNKERRADGYIMPESVADRMIPAMRAALDKMMLQRVKVTAETRRDRQGAFTVDMLGNMNILIGQSVDLMATLYHESIHAMKEMNLFTDAEWSALEAEAAKTWMKKYDIEGRYPKLNRQDQIEEAIAEAFGAWGAANGKGTQSGMIATAFAKMKRMVQAIRNAANGLGFENSESIFGKAMSGEVGSRPQNGSRTFDAKDQATPAAAGKTDSAPFKKWFGGSKIVDADGKPLVVYHGSRAAGLESFDTERVTSRGNGDEAGTYFTDDQMAAGNYARPPFGSPKGGPRGRTYAAYLSIKNPLNTTALINAGMKKKGAKFGDVKRAVLAENLDRAVHDGIVFEGNNVNPAEYVAFEPAQIKSVDNRGTFDPASTNIREQAMPVRKPATGAMLGGAYIPDRGVWDALTEGNARLFARLGNAKEASGDQIDRARIKLQDRMLPILRAQQAVERETGSKVTEKSNAYLAEETFSGKVGKHLFDIDENFTKPIIDLIGKTKGGITVDSVGEWLTARHAVERNQYIASINDQMPDGGSGMMTADALQILYDAAAGDHAATLDDIGVLMDKLREVTVKMRVGAGLMTQDEADLWAAQYAHYVPLKGWAETDHADATLQAEQGRRFNVRGAETKRALGRSSEAFNPLQAMLTQAQEVAIRAEKNRVANAMFQLAEANPAPAMWEIKKPKMKRYFNRATGLVETRIEQPLGIIMAPNEMAVKVDGKEYRILFNDDRLARAMGNIGADQMGAAMRIASGFSRYVSTVNTMMNPEFTVTNAFRDITAASINIQSFGEADRKRIGIAMIRDWRKALAGAYGGMKGKKNTEWQKHYAEFEKAGGKVSFWVMDQPEAGKADLEKRIGLQHGSKLRQASKFIRPSLRDNPALALIERANMAVDNAVRLAAFVEARKAGWTPAQAASLSKNLTVNFNRRGEAGSSMNAIWTFANASIQGNTIILKALKSSRVRRIAVGIVGAGIVLDLINASLSDEDDDDELAYDKIPDFKNKRNLILNFAGGDNPFTIPLPYGWSLFSYAGQQMGKVARGVKSPGDAVGDVLAASFETFSPMGSGTLLQIITPTALDPVMEMAINEDWLGRPIRPESPYGDYGPDAYKAFASVRSSSAAISEGMNVATGGSRAESGSIDVSPEYLDHVFNFIAGGAGRFVGDVADIAGKVVTGQTSDVRVSSIPFAGNLYTESGIWLDSDRYYRFRDEVLEAKEARDLNKTTGAWISDNTRSLSNLADRLKVSESAMKAMRKDRRDVMGNDALSRAQKSAARKLFDERENRIVLGFNRAFVAAMGNQGE
jgi:hypothetical protein